jgi:ribosomal protein S27AE
VRGHWTIHPSPVSHCLQFSVCPHQPLPSPQLLMAVSHPGTMVGCPPGFLSHDCSVLLGPQNISLSNNRPLLKMVPGYSTPIYWKKQNVFPVLACHTGGVAVILNPHTGFNVCGKCGLILWLDVTVCCYQDSLAYLVVVVSAFSPPWRAGVGAMDCFLLFSASLVFLCAFQLSYHLFLDSWCSFSLVLFRI